jgi:hypothetical protein
MIALISGSGIAYRPYHFSAFREVIASLKKQLLVAAAFCVLYEFTNTFKEILMLIYRNPQKV